MIKLLLLAVVPFVTEHRYMTPRTEVTTNLYGSVTGVVDKTYILSQIGNSKVSDVQTNGVSIVNDGIANLKESDPTVPHWAKSELANPATVTTAGRAADALKVKEELDKKLDKSGGTLTGDLVISENKTLTVGTRKGPSGIYSVVEGNSNTASGSYSHSEGNNNISSGPYSHAEGGNNVASGPYSHAEGGNNAAKNRYEHAQGRYNVSHSSANDAESTLFSIGAGTSDSDHKNAIETMMDGKTFVLGVGGYNGTNPTGQPNAANDVATVIEGKAEKSDVDSISASVNNLSIEVEGKQDDIGIVKDEYTVVMPPGRSLAVRGGLYVTESANIIGSLDAPYITVNGVEVALRSDIPAPVEVIDPSSATTTGKAADALKVKEALNGKLDAYNGVAGGLRIGNYHAQPALVIDSGDNSYGQPTVIIHDESNSQSGDGAVTAIVPSSRLGDGSFIHIELPDREGVLALTSDIPAPYTPPPYLRVYDEVRQCWWRGRMVDGVMNWEVE